MLKKSLLLVVLSFAAACSNNGSGAEGSGGSQGSGGATGTGGGSATGGSNGTGGSSQSGGATGSGGSSAKGGSTGSGGSTASGGSTGSGGASANGGSTGSGGASASGGSSGTGGKAGSSGSGGSAGGAGAAGSGSGGAAGGHGGSAAGAGGATSTGGAAGSSTDGGLSAWKLSWSDEFNGADGTAVDSTKWVYDTGGNGFGNSEYEYYTSGTANAVQQGGNLVITATTTGAASHTCSYPSNGPCQYTSARIKTLGKFSQQYGRFEARIQIPEGQGIWPAFWMMGVNGNWPACGEIDVMENIGKEPSINHGSMHMPASGSTSDDQLTGMYTLAGGAKLGDAFHIYAVEWTSSQVAFYVDDTLYEMQTKAGTTGRTWEFDQAFYILLNVAVGGTWPGAPDSTTTFPQTMKVDYVRVYQPAN